MNNSPPPPYPGPNSDNFVKVPLDPSTGQQRQATAPTGIQIHTNIGPPPPIVVRAVHAHTALFGPYPVEMDCPYCRCHIEMSQMLANTYGTSNLVTHTKQVPGALPWIILAVCFVLGFFLLIPWCLCCLPFCIDSCLDVIHTCPSCKHLVGRFARL